METHNEILYPVENYISEKQDVILDVSSMPKRFFFPILKILLSRPDSVESLVVTYSAPEVYFEGKLAENFDDWDHLPLFGISKNYGSDMPNLLLVGVGFEAYGLQEQVEHAGTGLPVKLLLPFPAPPEAFQRSWEMVRKLRKYSPDDNFELFRVEAKNVSDAFDRLVDITNNGAQNSVLAPFGPKPISVAMCIYAALTKSEVFYTQPTVYHPDYSSGISMVNGNPEIYAYCIRLDGKNFYEI